MPDELLAAILNGNDVSVVQLLATGIPLDTPGVRGSLNALLCAASAGRLDLIRALVERGADVNYANRHGLTALHGAASSGNAGLAKLLIELGADIEREALDGVTPLHLAAAWGSAEVMRLLLDAGARRDHRDARGWDAVMFAEEKDQEEILRVLAPRPAASPEQVRADIPGPPVGVFPIGETLGDGAYRVEVVLQGAGFRKLGMGRGASGSGGCFIALNRSSSAQFAAYRRSVSYQIPGVLPLLHVGSLDGVDGGDVTSRTSTWGMVEAVPQGVWLPDVVGRIGPDELLEQESRPASRRGTIDLVDALSLGRSAGTIAARAWREGVLLKRLRPEGMFVARVHDALEVTGLSDRAESFFALTRVDVWSPPVFDRSYEAPEAFDETCDDRALVFSLSVMVAEWATGGYPYKYKFYAAGPQTGKHLPLKLPESLARLLSRGMRVNPAERPRLAEFLEQLHV